MKNVGAYNHKATGFYKRSLSVYPSIDNKSIDNQSTLQVSGVVTLKARVGRLKARVRRLKTRVEAIKPRVK